MGIVLFFLAYTGMLVTRAVTRRSPPANRLTHRQLRNFGVRQLLFVAVLALAWQHSWWTRESVGVPAQIRWLETLLAGEVGFLVVILCNLLLMIALRRLGVMRLVAARGNLRLWPRGRAAKWIAALFIMVFNPFVEELVMRGVLIHQWGLVLGSPVLPIAVGFLLNGALHWYQGWRMQAWHAMYFAVAVWLLYSPWGLPAAMAAHVLGDVLPILLLRRNLEAAHAARRRELRRAPA